MKKIYFFLIFVCVLQFSSRAEAVSLELTSDGGGAYTLRGVDFANVGGVSVEIRYDTSTLQMTQVTQITKGALLFPTQFVRNNNYSPSSIFISAAASAPYINGTGILATIKFTPI